MILIGMTGPIGHGKTTLADALARLEPRTAHFESSLIIAEVANAMHEQLESIPDPYDIDSLNGWLQKLPPILEHTVHVKCSFDDIRLRQQAVETHPVEYQKLIMHVENLQRQPELARKKIDKDNKETYRPFLQWLGGYMVQKVAHGIWYDEIVRRVKDAEANGAQLCIVGGLRFPTDAAILRAAGGIIIKVYRPGHLQNDMLDPTERERANIELDTTIMSNGTVEDVGRCAKRLLDDIRSGSLQKVYQTARS
jgi:hypothetical protein